MGMKQDRRGENDWFLTYDHRFWILHGRCVRAPYRAVRRVEIHTNSAIGESAVQNAIHTFHNGNGHDVLSLTHGDCATAGEGR